MSLLDIAYTRERVPQDRVEAQALIRAVHVQEFGIDLTIPDWFDDNSIYVIGRHQGAVVSAARIIFPDAAGHLPIDYFLEIPPKLPAGAVACELGRLSVRKDCRGRYLPHPGVRVICQVLREQHVTHVFFDSPLQAEPLYRAFGFERICDAPFYSDPSPNSRLGALP